MLLISELWLNLPFSLPTVPNIKNYVVVAENVDFSLRYPCEDSVISTLFGGLFFYVGKYLFVNMSLSLWEDMDDLLHLLYAWFLYCGLPWGVAFSGNFC
jgi:hypothetical protein